MSFGLRLRRFLRLRNNPSIFYNGGFWVMTQKGTAKKDFYGLLRGKRVVIQCKGKAVRYEGVLCGFDSGFIILSNAVVYGTQHVAYADLLGVDRSVVQHIHLVPEMVEKLRMGVTVERA